MYNISKKCSGHGCYGHYSSYSTVVLVVACSGSNWHTLINFIRVICHFNNMRTFRGIRAEGEPIMILRTTAVLPCLKHIDFKLHLPINNKMADFDVHHD